MLVCIVMYCKAEFHRSFITTTVLEQRPRSHHKGATGRVRTWNQRYPVLCHCVIPVVLCLHTVVDRALLFCLPNSDQAPPHQPVDAGQIHCGKRRHTFREIFKKTPDWAMRNIATMTLRTLFSRTENCQRPCRSFCHAWSSQVSQSIWWFSNRQHMADQQELHNQQDSQMSAMAELLLPLPLCEARMVTSSTTTHSLHFKSKHY